jgi:hypothetical protein
MWNHSLGYAALSGLYASLASVCGKLALSSHVAHHWLRTLPVTLHTPYFSVELRVLSTVLDVSFAFLLQWLIRGLGYGVVGCWIVCSNLRVPLPLRRAALRSTTPQTPEH